MAEKVVVDTNVIITAIMSGSPFVVDKLSNPLIEVVSPKFLVVELFKHSPRIQAKSNLTEEEVLDTFSGLIESITLYNESDISIGSWSEAYRLVKNFDEKDAPFVALTLELGARLWTNDYTLKAGLQSLGFTTFYP